MKNRILSCLVLAVVSLGPTACVDPEIDSEHGYIGPGESSVSLGVTFRALSNGSLGATRSQKGDLIGTIGDVFVAWYTEDGALAGSDYLPRDRMDVTDVERPGSATELRTQRAEFQCRIPYGRYRIYAVANMGDLSADATLAARIGARGGPAVDRAGVGRRPGGGQLPDGGLLHAERFRRAHAAKPRC